MYATAACTPGANSKRVESQVMSPRYPIFLGDKSSVAIHDRDGAGLASDTNVCSNPVVPRAQCGLIIACAFETMGSVVSKRFLALRLAWKNGQPTTHKFLC